MPTSYLPLARHNGQPVNEQDLKIGFVVDYPSGMGGTIKCICTKLTAESATFLPLNKEFPNWAGFTARFHVPDFTLEDFTALGEALKAYNGYNTLPNEHERELVKLAQSLGYTSCPSYTQAAWTEAGIARFQQLKQALSARCS